MLPNTKYYYIMGSHGSEQHALNCNHLQRTAAHKAPSGALLKEAPLPLFKGALRPLIKRSAHFSSLPYSPETC